MALLVYTFSIVIYVIIIVVIDVIFGLFDSMGYSTLCMLLIR